MTKPRPRKRLVPRVTITFACDPEFFDQLEAYADRHDVSRSMAVRQLLTYGLAQTAADGDQIPGQMEMAS